MSAKVIISADSTCDLSKELIAEYGIKIIPLYINLADKVCRDGVDVTPDDIYDFVEKTGKLPTTSAINPEEYRSVFEALHKETGCDIVHINISSDMSSCHQNASLVAEILPYVHAVDSMNLSTGSGHLVIEAANMAKSGMTAEEIVTELENLRGKVDASFVLNTLEYLHKGGRCSAVAALGANILKLKPCIEVQNGKMGVGKKYRGAFSNVLKEYANDRLQSVNVKKDRVFITHSGCDKELIDDLKEQIAKLNMFDNIYITQAGCTITSHCGPNTLGVLFIRQ